MYMKMERFMEKQTCSTPNTTLSPPLPMHKNSHTISKSKPKIRIIHIFAPEIIKTDAANFRELVQRLTGKPTADDHHRNINCCTKTRISLRKKEERVLSSTSNKKMEVSSAVMGSERIKGEEEIWRAANSGGGFLAGFADQFDGFMQELNHFPFLEGTTQINDAANHGGGGDHPQLIA